MTEIEKEKEHHNNYKVWRWRNKNVVKQPKFVVKKKPEVVRTREVIDKISVLPSFFLLTLYIINKSAILS